MSAKSMVLELDSIQAQELMHYAKNGAMPFIKKLLNAEKMAELRYEVPYQIATWLSMHSGQSVKQHQRLAYDDLTPGSYKATQAGYGLAPGMMYWEYLDEAGLSNLVLNNICGQPKTLNNGIHLVEFGAHSAGNYRTATSFPPELAQDLTRQFPHDLFNRNDWGNMKFVNIDRLVESTGLNLDRKCDVFCNLIEKKPWDHVHLCLDDLHNIGHMLWHLKSGDQKDADCLFFRMFQKIDAAIERVVRSTGSDTNLMIVCAAGIGQKNGWSHSLDNIIEKYCSVPAKVGLDLYGWLGWAWSKTPHAITSRLVKQKTNLREKYLMPRRARSQAFSFPKNEESGGIRINLRGREAKGIIGAGQEYEALCTDLTKVLLELRDTESDIPLVTEVVNVPHLLGIEPLKNAKLPDLAVVWSRDKRITTVQSERLGRISQDFEPARSGDHVIDGLIVVHGPAWDGVSIKGQMGPMDIAPTLADLHQVQHNKLWNGESLFSSN